ncbi:hypothetical protein Ocin01_17922, partial [Orchesella cincta]
MASNSNLSRSGHFHGEASGWNTSLTDSDGRVGNLYIIRRVYTFKIQAHIRHTSLLRRQEEKNFYPYIDVVLKLRGQRNIIMFQFC